jgi:hypothetical protein
VQTGFLVLIRQCRRPLIAVAIGILVLQTVVAGLAAAPVAAPFAPFDAICHGAGGTEAPADTAPGPGKSGNAVCCAFCTAAAAALLPVPPPAVGHFERGADASLSPFFRNAALIAWRAIRAGPSQAPPSLA